MLLFASSQVFMPLSGRDDVWNHRHFSWPIPAKHQLLVSIISTCTSLVENELTGIEHSQAPT